MLNVKNNDGLTPFDVVNDITVNNFFMNHLFNRVKECEHDIIELNSLNVKLKKHIIENDDNTKNFILFILSVLMAQIAYRLLF